MADPSSSANSTKTVTVGCKLPNGIFIELIPEAVPGVFTPPPAGKRIKLKGSNGVRNDLSVRGLAQPVFPYGITSGVSAELWEAWLKRNADSPLVTGGFIFALAKERDALAEAKERETERTGLEPLNPSIELDPRTRVPRSARPEQRVTADPERLSELNRRNSGAGQAWERD